MLTDPYRLGVGGNVDSVYSQKVLVDTPGFSPEVVSAFRYSESGGRRLDETRPLYWGRGYYLLWHTSLKLPWPERIWREALHDAGPWCAARIELPVPEDDASVAWADRYLGRDIQRPPLTLSLIHPATALRVEDDSLVVDEGEGIVVGITGESGAESPETLSVSSQSGIGHNSLRLPNRLPLLFSVTGFSSGTTRLTLDDDDETELVVEFKPKSGYQTLPRPTIHLLAEGTEYGVPIHCAAAKAALEVVRAGSIALTRIDLEPLREVQLRTRERGQRTWRAEAFTRNLSEETAQPNNARHMEQSVLAAIQDALDKLQALDLDCGNYGRILLSEAAVAMGPRREVRLTNALRGRIRWLLQMVAHSQHAGSALSDQPFRQAIEGLLAFDYPEPRDREMLALLGRATSWPPALVAHVRTLEGQLKQLRSTAS